MPDVARWPVKDAMVKGPETISQIERECKQKHAVGDLVRSNSLFVSRRVTSCCEKMLEVKGILVKR
jgi:hypothetical protein